MEAIAKHAIRHAAVFLLLMVAAFLIADRMPLSVDSEDIFLYALLVFLAYLGVSWLTGR